MAIIKLVQGGAELDLVEAPYSVQKDFIPPAANMQRAVANGTAFNRYGGGELVGEVGRNQRFAFTVLVRGASVGEIQAAIARLGAFLTGYKNPVPLYLEHSPYDIPAPSWGTFAAPLRYRIVSADVRHSADYGSARLRESGVRVQVTLELAPGATGRPQKVANAKGSIAIDTIPGQNAPLGIELFTGQSNQFLNPIFGNATWNTGWTATGGAAFSATKNTDPDYKTFDASARLSSLTTGMYSQVISTLTAGTIITSYTIKLQNGAVPTTSDCQCYIGSARATSFYPLGNGFYQMYSTAGAGIGATTVGIQVKSGKTVYLCNAFASYYFGTDPGWNTPIAAHGDMTGCVWTSTRHNSETVIGQGQLRIQHADILNAAEGSICVAWRNMPYSPGNGMFFDLIGYNAAGAPFNFEGYFMPDSVIFHDLTAADTNNPMETAVYCFTWGASGKKIYKNGVLLGSNSTALPLYFSGEMVIGEANALYIDGILHMFQTWNEELTAAEVASLYTEAIQVINDGYACNMLPFLWTKDGDGTLDAVDDGGYDNWGVLAGIPGTLPAEVELGAVQTVGTMVSTHISASPIDRAYSPSYLWDEAQGVGDATCSGTEYQNFAGLTTSDVEVGTVTISDAAMVRDMILGRDWYAVVRMREAAGTGTIAAKVHITIGAQTYESDYAYFATDTTFKLQRIGPVNAPAIDYLYDSSFDLTASVVLRLYLKRTTGTADMRVDFIDFLPAPLAYLEATGTNNTFILKGGQAAAFADSAYTGANACAVVLGDVIEAEPGKYTNIVIHVGKPGAAHVITNTLTANMYVTPRWSLL